MQFIPFIAISLHVLAGVFWAGSSFTLARAGAAPQVYQRLWRPQIGSAAIAFVSGGYLGHTFHRGPMSAVELSLAFAIFTAILALALQVSAAVSARRAEGSTVFFNFAQRAAAVLLVLTVIGMGGARYAEPVQRALAG